MRAGRAVLTSKLIDGSFPDYARVIPKGNDKKLTVDNKAFEAAVDRVSTVSAERSRSVKMSLSEGRLGQTRALTDDTNLSSIDVKFAGRLALATGDFIHLCGAFQEPVKQILVHHFHLSMILRSAFFSSLVRSSFTPFW